MFKNYLKLGIRNLLKNRLSTSINILGLALAVGCCMVVFAFFDWSIHMDNFHHKLNNLFVVERITENNGNKQFWGNSPAPLGPVLKSDFPQIKSSTRVKYEGVIIKQGANVFRESVSFVDNSFYNMFDFPVKWGNRNTFNDPDGIVLTDELAQKLFGNENPIGKNINLRFADGGHSSNENFTIKGVFEKMPIESSWYFSALLPYNKMAALGLDSAGRWNKSADITFLEQKNTGSLSSIKDQMGKYVKIYNAANRNEQITSFHFQPLAKMAFHSYQVNNSRFNSTNMAGYIMLIVVAISLLLLVYFNYLNIAIAAD